MSTYLWNFVPIGLGAAVALAVSPCFLSWQFFLVFLFGLASNLVGFHEALYRAGMK
jgi:hypothetical protein